MKIEMREGSYLDTNFLLKLYLLEVDSARAVTWIERNTSDIFVSPLTDVELVTVFSREDSPVRASRAIRDYRDDLAAHLYIKLDIDDQVFASAVDIAERYSRPYKLRSLDVLHLATAVRHGVSNFGTFDKRLAEAAAGMRLRVLPERS